MPIEARGVEFPAARAIICCVLAMYVLDTKLKFSATVV